MQGLAKDHTDPDVKHESATKFSRTTMSTAFSGIGSPEVAAMYWVCWMMTWCGGGLEFALLPALWAIEIDHHARAELLASRFHCIFCSSIFYLFVFDICIFMFSFSFYYLFLFLLGFTVCKRGMWMMKGSQWLLLDILVILGLSHPKFAFLPASANVSL